MLRLAFVVIVILLQTSPIAALDKKVLALMRSMDCTKSQLTDTQQRFKLASETRVWLIVNEGPTDIGLWASNGDRVAVFKPYASSTGVTVFAGDARYDYSVKLLRKGSALVHACTARN